jgi:hypothetical protein
MGYSDQVSKLAPLEAFDGRVFLPGAKAPQEVCSLVLSFALVYNDIRDIILGHVLLRDTDLPERERPSPSLGQFNGLGLHLIRLQAATVHELLQLIAEESSAVAHPSFRDVLRLLTPAGREAWTSLEEVASGRWQDTPLSRVLFFLRNKIGYHYDTKELARGYKTAFGKGEPPYLSRGSAMQSTRFYFADAAAEAYMLDKAKDPEVRNFLKSSHLFLDQINQALHEIVTRFVAYQGFGWRKGASA